METNLKSFGSDRKFFLFRYEISHGSLLLRSGRTDEYHTRIDVMIMDVRAMEIRSWCEGFEIVKVDQDYLRNFHSNPTDMVQAGLSVYALSGKGWKGFIVGGSLCVHEDEADLTAPSALSRDTETDAAARVLYETGRFHHWWPREARSYDEFAASDPIGASEFGGVVERMLAAADRARLKAGMPLRVIVS